MTNNLTTTSTKIFNTSNCLLLGYEFSRESNKQLGPLNLSRSRSVIAINIFVFSSNKVTLKQVKLLFGPLVIQLVWYIPSVLMKVVDIYLHFGE